MDGAAEQQLEKLSQDIMRVIAGIQGIEERLSTVEMLMRGSDATKVAFDGHLDSIGYKHGTIGRVVIGTVPPDGSA